MSIDTKVVDPDGMSMFNVLDKGYVRLVDHMGSDLSVVNAARASFAKESFELSEKDEKLIHFLVREGHMSPLRHAFMTFEFKAPLMVARQHWKYCFSDDTEVLTQAGWKRWPKVTYEDELAAVTEDGHFFFEKPSDLISYEFKGDMVHIANSKLDILVTPNHRMFVSSRTSHNNESSYKDFSFRQAESLLTGDHKMPLLPKVKLENGDDKDYWRGFHYGFSLADGNFTASKNRVYISVKKERKIHDIKSMMNFLPHLDWHILDGCKDEGYYKVSCSKPDWGYYEGKTNEKKLIFDSNDSENYLKGILDGYFQADGNSNQFGTKQIGSASFEMIESLSMLCTYLGIPTSVTTVDMSKSERYSNDDMYYLNISENRYHHTSRAQRELIDYSGLVYCATVSTGLLLVRRNGKTYVAGNCVSSDHTMDGWNESCFPGYQHIDLKKKTNFGIVETTLTIEEIYEEFLENPDSVYILKSLNEDYSIIENTISKIWYSGVQQVYKVTLANGMSIEATGNHKFLTENGYKELRFLGFSDKIFTIENDKTNQVHIKSIESVREYKTYDVEMSVVPNLCFNGIVVHNSRRYVTQLPEFYIPTPEQWRAAPEDKKQGSGENLSSEIGITFTEELDRYCAEGESLYNYLMDQGVCAEQARLFLPAYGLYVNYRWSASLQSVAHFINQRVAHDAQKEIQDYAIATYHLVRPLFPITLEALGVKID